MFLLGSALVIALAGCGSDGSGGSGGSGGGEAAGGGPPPGGWPQPENGRLTEKMCGLLTNADYAKYGHHRLPSVSAKPVEGGNGVECLYMTQDELSLGLQPTAQAAKLVYAAGLKEHKDRLASDHRSTILATGVVPGADESWFDYWTLGTEGAQYKEHELQLRRGSLLVTLILSGLRGKSEKDPREVLTGLAGLVLERIPDVGKTDTGVTHKVQYEVTGSGTAKLIMYYDPAESKTVQRKNVRLPWRLELPMAGQGGQQIPLTLNATSSGPLAVIGCSVSVDGRSVKAQPPQIGLAFCTGTFTEGAP
ncbi:MmpS family transport accessory protein [Actinomadura scrupuli]|uniref:MmpS family transport accessory protein n=1 Tax=Actinomadura scrupuli TaxID=559629 RepID=UPI003D99F83C